MKCRILLRPFWKNNCIDYMEVKYYFDHFMREEGDELCKTVLSAYTVPGCEAENLHVWDDCGEAPVMSTVSEPYPYKYRHFWLKRRLSGAVRVCYLVHPRPLLPGDRCAPYVDFRCEEGGGTSAGSAFLADFGNLEGETTLSWDFSHMPAGSRGICAFGEGEVTLSAGPGLFRDCYYSIGAVKSITEGDFGIYWLAEPDFDMEAIAGYTQKLYGGMQKFFQDPESIYRIFVRKDPYSHSGGSAMARSYMFGWNETEPVSLENKKSILAHEMVHNWPHLDDSDEEITSWYSEGAADYYSMILPLRMGLITPKEAMQEIQSMTDSYYTNPTRHLSDKEAARICWQDWRAQKLPYGRGLLLFTNTDVKIRQATKGAHSIDDVVLSILKKRSQGIVQGNKEFLETVREIAGIDIADDLEVMRSGGHFAPLSGGFDGHFHVVTKEATEADTGKTVTSYQWELF